MFKDSSFFKSQTFWTIVCAIGIWGLFIDNLIVNHSDKVTQSVTVEGGNINAHIDGWVDTHAFVVNGSYHPIPIDIQKILGGNIGSHFSYKKDGEDYWSIDTYKSGGW